MKKRILLLSILCCGHLALAAYAACNLLQSQETVSPTVPATVQENSAEDESVSDAGQVNPTENAVVSDPEPENSPEAESVPPAFVPFTVQVRSNLHIRLEPSLNARITGRMPSGSTGNITGLADDKWAKISYGDLEGYASLEYLSYDADALAAFLASPGDASLNPASDPEPQTEERTAAEETLRIVNTCYIRSLPDASTKENIVSVAQAGDTFLRMPEYDSDGWYAIHIDGQKTAYVSSSYAAAG